MGISKKQLEIKLQELEDIKDPKAEYEQYSTPPSLGASILYIAFLKGNIKDKKVIDLGCGSGILAIGAAILGAKEVIGFDIDKEVIELAKRNSKDLDINVRWKVKEIKKIEEKANTVIQNPPFGAQSKGNDRPFIKKALKISPIVYSLHKAETDEFIENFVQKCGGRVEEKVEISFPISRTFNFHKEKEKPVKVNLYKFIRAKND